jgi:hypothetical protein
MIREPKKIIRNLALPKKLSIGVPNECSANILKARWIGRALELS